ncbi:Alpha/beta hydrolase family [Shewanella psychrophila]|uniref:Alpha/beta hydrolase family n=1 Tax=Shewanella psychrophila TaxID=225848 RepID=A0A1S6HNV7_9GAMM|nr:alpha/beta fold hydrolase [Shewanella psychrophila]AQS37179.1 Alpha/beta hydrolase family [Shewanella psychrophila]
MNRILMLIIVTYVGLGVMLYLMQRSFIYFPTGAVEHRFNEAIFENDGASTTSILLNKGQKKAIIYFGGNAENVAFTAPEFEQAFKPALEAEFLEVESSPYSIYLVNYRGYGSSEGTPSETALFSDALALYDHLVLTHESVFVIGRSLGSGVASYIASERPVEKLVLVTPFDSIQSIAQKQFPFYPMSILLKDKFNSVERAGNIHSDTLILAAESDKIVRRQHTDKLIESLVNRAPEVVFIEDAGHNDISQYPKYYQSMKAFLKAR